ncbi:hypothetical protein NPIL_697991 [Nephila pilipes]|uniref:Uncharacterized protein n=1 Tax=Nephila pilipes TaxID=299642 RepID=A0A8X6UHN6_NEPPI|nr:hypothetical protein NPIL_697991 [Nephila pilipes]
MAGRRFPCNCGFYLRRPTDTGAWSGWDLLEFENRRRFPMLLHFSSEGSLLPWVLFNRDGRDRKVVFSLTYYQALLASRHKVRLSHWLCPFPVSHNKSRILRPSNTSWHALPELLKFLQQDKPRHGPFNAPSGALAPTAGLTPGARFLFSQPFSWSEGWRRVGQQLNETSSHHALLSVNHRSREARDSCRLLKYPGNRNFSRLPDNCVSRTTALNNATASVRCLLTRGIR